MGFVEELKACYCTTGHRGIGKDAIAARSNNNIKKKRLNHRLWSHSGQWGWCSRRVDGLFCFKCTLSSSCDCNQVETCFNGGKKREVWILCSEVKTLWKQQDRIYSCMDLGFVFLFFSFSRSYRSEISSSTCQFVRLDGRYTVCSGLSGSSRKCWKQEWA